MLFAFAFAFAFAFDGLLRLEGSCYLSFRLSVRKTTSSCTSFVRLNLRQENNNETACPLSFVELSIGSYCCKWWRVEFHLGGTYHWLVVLVRDNGMKRMSQQ